MIPGSPLPQPPQQPSAGSGRIVAYVIAGGLLGVVAWGLALTLLVGLVSGWTVTDAQTGALGFAVLVTMPIGGLLGALGGMRRGRRFPRPRRPIDTWRRRPNRVVDVRRDRDRG